MRGNYARGLAAFLIGLLLVQGEGLCSVEAAINREMLPASRFERRIHPTVPAASVPEATPAMTDGDEVTIGGGVGGQSTVTGAVDLEELRAQRLKELIGDLSVSLPTQMAFSIDLFETQGKGQVYSEDYCFQNFSKVDVQVKLENIRCEFSNKSQYQSLDLPEQLDRRSPKKQVYLYLEQMNGLAGAVEASAAEASPVEGYAEPEKVDRRQGPGVVITDVPKEDSYSFILSADPGAENNQVRFRMTGAVNELSKYTWRSGEIKVKVDFSIEPLIDEELIRQVDEEVRDEQVLDDEILDEDELVWRLAQEEAERRRAEQEAADREKAKENAAAQPAEPDSDASRPTESGLDGTQPSGAEPDASQPSEPDASQPSEPDASQPSEPDASQSTQPSEDGGNGQGLETEGSQDSQSPDVGGGQGAGADTEPAAGEAAGTGQDQDMAKGNLDESGKDAGQADWAEQDVGSSRDDGEDGLAKENQKTEDKGSGIGETNDES